MKRWTVRDLYRRLTSDDGRWQNLGLPRAVYRWAIVFYKELQRDKAFIRAAGLCYLTLIALVPLLLLIFGVLGATGLLAPNQGLVEDLLFRTVLGDVPGVKDFLLPGLLEVDLAALGVVGVLGLLFVSGRLYLTVELAYNDIYGVRVERPLSTRMMNFYFTLTALPIAIATAVFGTQEWLPIQGVSRVATPLVMFALLLAALKLFPCRPVTWRAALIGATVSAVLLELGGRLFPLYIRLFASDDPLRIVYGSLGLIPVFLLWLYMLWVFVLLGVEVAYVVQHFRSLAAAEDALAEADTRVIVVPPPSLPFEVLILVGERFGRGAGPMPFEELIARTHVIHKELRGVVAVLEASGYLLTTDHGWALSRPPEQIALREVLDAWRELTWLRGVQSDRVGDAFVEAIAERLAGTLSDAIREYFPEQEAASR